MLGQPSWRRHASVTWKLGRGECSLNDAFRRKLAHKAFSLTAKYDAAISRWLFEQERNDYQHSKLELTALQGELEGGRKLTTAYRWHIADPIRFHRYLKVTIEQQIRSSMLDVNAANETPQPGSGRTVTNVSRPSDRMLRAAYLLHRPSAGRRSGDV